MPVWDDGADHTVGVAVQVGAGKEFIAVSVSSFHMVQITQYRLCSRGSIDVATVLSSSTKALACTKRKTVVFSCFTH